MDLEEFARIKRNVEKKQREYERAKGALQQLLGQLKKDYGAKTAESGRELERQWGEQVASWEKEYAKQIEQLVKDHPELSEE